jgi:hypothetical protein
VSQQLGALPTHNTDTFLFISHTKKVTLFKVRCNIFTGVRIIKEMPGSVASGTLFTIGTPFTITAEAKDGFLNSFLRKLTPRNVF